MVSVLDPSGTLAAFAATIAEGCRDPAARGNRDACN
jgi:hypothetical protein